MKRDEALSEVERCVLQDRNASYGSPENNFSRVAKLWTAYFDREFEPHDVAVMLALLKVARLNEQLRSSPDDCQYTDDVPDYAHRALISAIGIPKVS